MALKSTSNEPVIVPEVITNALIHSFAKMVKSPTRSHVRTFIKAIKTFEKWDETGT